jgi:uncharacterized phage-associated protein
MDAAQQLASWILFHQKGDVTHLKLQKLAFYAYAVALAGGLEQAFNGEIEFEAWQHGPVSRSIWEQYRHYEDNPIAKPKELAVRYDAELVSVLQDVLTVYGPLSPWALRNQSHLETPWKELVGKKPPIFKKEVLRQYFEKKFSVGNVTYPELLTGGASLMLDGIPRARFKTFAQLAEQIRDAWQRNFK